MIDTGKMLLAIEASGDKNIDLPMLTQKLKWDVQIEGCYDLLYKYINVDYPTRQEVEMFMIESFNTHDATHYHNGIASYSFPTPIGNTPTIPMLTFLIRSKTPVKVGGIASVVGAGV